MNVDNSILQEYGAVSEECAKEMAQGLMEKTGCDVSLCTTGIAGPTGGSDEKPVGLCFISCKYKDKISIKKIILNPELKRKEMKEQFALQAIDFAYTILTGDDVGD